MIADIEPVYRPDIKFVFVYRFDCEPDQETIMYVSHKFQTETFKSHLKWEGWPAGPNGMAVDILRALDGRTKTGEWKDITGMLLIEPDCVPLTTAWLYLIMHEWEQARAQGKWIMGAWRDSGTQWGHINGNCVVRPDFAKLVDLDCVSQHFAWDCAVSYFTHDHWHITSLILNCFQSVEAQADQLFIGELHALVHGFKDQSAFNLAQEIMFPEKRYDWTKI
jgi:hypothetical protein